MELLLPGFYTSMQFLVLLGLGFFIRKTGMIDAGFQKSVSGFLVKVALPVFFFTNMGKADIAFLKDSLYMPAAAAVNVILAICFSWLVFRVLPLAEKEKRAGIALGTFGNAGYIPLSLIEIFPMTMPVFSAAYGGEKAVVLVGVYLFIYSPLLWSVGNYFISKNNVRFSFKELLSPSLYGIIIGLLIPVFNLQPFIFNPRFPVIYIFSALERLGSILTPLILVNLGAMIAGIKIHSSIKKQMNLVLAGVMLVRYLILPVIFYLLYFFLLKPFNVDKSIVFVLFLEFHIPPANNLSTMAMDAGVNEDVTAYVLLITYLAYVLLLPVFLLFFTGLSA